MGENLMKGEILKNSLFGQVMGAQGILRGVTLGLLRFFS